MKLEDEPHPLLRDDRDSSEPVDVSGLFAAVAAQTIDKTPSLHDRLVELSTELRTVGALAGMLIVGGIAVAALGIRAELEGTDLLRVVASVLILVSLSAGSAGVALRGLHRGALEPGVAWGLGLFSLALPLLFASIPAWWPGLAPDGWATHLTCFGRGLLTTVGTSTAVLLFIRTRHPVPTRLLAASGAGGLSGMAVQQLVCSGNTPLHLLACHGSLGFVVAGIVVFMASMRD